MNNKQILDKFTATISQHNANIANALFISLHGALLDNPTMSYNEQCQHVVYFIRNMGINDIDAMRAYVYIVDNEQLFYADNFTQDNVWAVMLAIQDTLGIE